MPKAGEYNGPSPASAPIATWVYDNANHAVAGMPDAIGQLTTETSYDQQGNPYTSQQDGFNNFGESTGQTITIPATTGTGPLAGTYREQQTYIPTDGLPLTLSYPASPGGGNLPAETLSYRYHGPTDVLASVVSNLASYAGNITYTPLYQAATEELGGAGTLLSDSYDPTTANLTRSQVAPAKGNPYDVTSYSYDASGLITGQTDVRHGTAQGPAQTEEQCFGYDTLDQLTSAWTANGTRTCQASPSPSTVSDGIPGSAYWTTWTYNPAGNQATQTQHATTSSGTNSVTTYTYNNGQGTTVGQPDTLTSAVTTGPGVGTASYTYDPDGNTTSRDLPAGNQTLTWTPARKLASDTTGAGTTNYVYDANGNLLLQQALHQTTLYLFGDTQQLTWTHTTTSTSQVTGIRLITFPCGVAVRTGTGTNYWIQLTDQHGTSLLTLNDNAQAPQWRQYTPYGAPRGQASSTWPDTGNGYLDDPTSPGTGLTLIGARAYDPITGRFLSTDPALNLASPQQLSGYAYAASNPVTNADPTGLYLPAVGGTCQYYEAGCQTATDTNPPLNLTNAGEGAIDAVYNTGLGILSLAAYANSSPQTALAISSLPAPFADSNPDNPSFSLGYGATLAAGFLLPGSDEAAAADIAADITADSAADLATTAPERLATTAAPERLAITAAPEQLATTGVNQSDIAAEDTGAAAGREIMTYYPPDRGFFDEPTGQVLETGTRIDRYGREGGTFVSIEGTPEPMRALPPGATDRPYNVYEVVNPFEVRAGTVAPWFGELGLGTQYELPDSVANLIENGYLKLAEDNE
jgi:RHS repeat-associated protein